MRLGVYSDLIFRRSRDGVSSDSAFARFLIGLAEESGQLTVFGRVDPEGVAGAISLPADLIDFVELPFYPSLHRLPRAVSSLVRSLPAFDQHLRDLDGIWLFGPHPLSVFVAWRARRRRVAVFLGVRQNLPDYVKGRFPILLEPFAQAAAWSLELAFRALARKAPTVVAGEELGRRWSGVAPSLLVTSFAVVRTAELVIPELAGSQPWIEPVHLLSVGRLEAEKNPLLLADVLRELGPGWQLSVAGGGPLRLALEHKIEHAGIRDRIDLLGPVSFGPDLLDLYRGADCFVHVSNTEGSPQVLSEAMAAGLPIVATDVGGVSAALVGGACGLLVPPGNAAAMAAAIRTLASDPSLRRALARRGRDEAARQTLELQAARVLRFFADSESPKSTARAKSR